MPIGTRPEKGRKAFSSIEADLPKWEKSGSLSPEEMNWWTGHLHGQFQYHQPNITTLSAFREHLRLAPTEEIVHPAVAEAINRHVTSLTQESTVSDVNYSCKSFLSCKTLVIYIVSETIRKQVLKENLLNKFQSFSLCVCLSLVSCINLFYIYFYVLFNRFEQ